MSDALHYDFHGIRLSIRSDDARIQDLLAARLGHFAAGSGDAQINFDYVTGANEHMSALRPDRARPVYDSVTGMVLFDQDMDRLLIDCDDRIQTISDHRNRSVATTLTTCAPDDCWTVSRPFFTLALLEQLKRLGMYGLHAALLARNGRALLVAGTSGAGKSTLAICLIRAGFDFGGDDLCFLVRGPAGLRILAFPEEIDVAESTIRFFPELHVLLARRRHPGAPKWQLLPETVYATEVVQECEPCMLVFPRIADASRSVLEPMSPTEALLELVPNVLLTEPQASQAHLDALGELVRRSQCWRLETGRDFERIPKLVGTLMTSETTMRHDDATAAGSSVFR